MSSDMQTPVKKRRVAGDAEAVDALVKAGSAAASGDSQYMQTVFQDTPALAGYIRSLWEKGTLKLALAKYLGTAASGENKLGEKLPQRALTIRSLPRALVWKVTFKAIEQCCGEDSVKDKGWVMSDGHAHNTLIFALQTTRRQPLPFDTVYFPEYEGAMSLVLLKRIEVKGNLLRAMTPENAEEFGYFAISADGPRKVTCSFFPGLEAETPLSCALVNSYDDWAIKDNLSHDAKLVSRKADFGVGLAILFEKQFQRTLPPLDDPISHPDAADSLKNETEPAGETLKPGPAAKAAAKAKSGPKAKAKSLAPSRPKKNKREATDAVIAEPDE